MGCMCSEPFPLVFTCTDEDRHGAVSPHGCVRWAPEGLEKVAEVPLSWGCPPPRLGFCLSFRCKTHHSALVSPNLFLQCYFCYY